jgi:hypothetical protein
MIFHIIQQAIAPSLLILKSDLYPETKEKRYITERLEKYQIDENDNQTKMLG